MIYLLLISTSFIFGFIIGRFFVYKIKNYGVSRKMFLILERQELLRDINKALEIKDYDLTISLHSKMERIDKKLKKIN